MMLQPSPASAPAMMMPPTPMNPLVEHDKKKKKDETQQHHQLPSWFVIKVTLMASLGGTLFGYDMGAIGGALPSLTQTFDLSQTQQEWVVSILYLGGGFGACVGGTLCDWGGRQKTILWTDVVFMLGAAWLYVANSYGQVLWGRFVVGTAVAVSGIADVSYLHEMAPLAWRGSIVSVNEACISLGFLLAYVAGYMLRQDQEWRIIFGLAGIMAVVQLVGMWGLPESPTWLAEQGRLEDAQRAQQQILRQGGEVIIIEVEPFTTTDSNNKSNIGGQDASSYQNNQHPLQPQLQSSSSLVILDSGGNKEGGKLLLRVKFQSFVTTLRRYRRQITICMFLAMVQQFCGQTNVLNYATYIFAQATANDNDENAPAWSTVTIGLVKFMVTVLVIWKIERVGRRTLLLGGMSLICLGLLCLMIAFGGSRLTSGDNNNDNNNNNNNNDIDSSSWGTMTVTMTGDNFKSIHFAWPGVLLVVMGYSMSFGPLTWLLTSELFPTDIRGRALGASTIVTYLCASLVTRTFLSAQTLLGTSTVFGIYCVITLLGVVFAYLAIPDTGEKTVEEIEFALHQMWWWRYDSLATTMFSSLGSENNNNYKNNNSSHAGGGGGIINNHLASSSSGCAVVEASTADNIYYSSHHHHDSSPFPQDRLYNRRPSPNIELGNTSTASASPNNNILSGSSLLPELT